jgi:hypothetical protein
MTKKVRVRWKWRSQFKGRQSGWATLLPKDGYYCRSYRVVWDDGTVGELVRADSLIIVAAQASEG